MTISLASCEAARVFKPKAKFFCEPLETIAPSRSRRPQSGRHRCSAATHNCFQRNPRLAKKLALMGLTLPAASQLRANCVNCSTHARLRTRRRRRGWTSRIRRLLFGSSGRSLDPARCTAVPASCSAIAARCTVDSSEQCVSGRSPSIIVRLRQDLLTRCE